MKVSIDLPDFINLLRAAEFGITKGKDFKGDHTLRAWKETFDRLGNTPLGDDRTQEERDQAFNNYMHDQVKRYGSN